MNKKLLFSMFAAITMLFVTSCTTEEPTADTANVRFALSKPQATQALSDGVGADLLVVAVYNSNGEEISHLRIEKDAFAGNTLTETVEFNLVKGQTYSIAFWAQTKGCGAYNYTDLRDIKVIDYATVVSNNEARDAFFGQVLDYTVTDAATTVTLKRPFAQLNFLVAEDDYKAAEAQGVAIAQSKVLVKELAAGFNALTGDVTGTAAADVEFALANIPTETVQLDVDGDGTLENYKHLSMNYVLANGATSAISDVTFTLTSAGSDIEIFSANTPLQRNWRTNVIGSLLDPATFTVEIAPAYDNDLNWELDGLVTIAEGVQELKGELLLTSPAGMQWLATELAKAENNGFQGKTIKLMADVDFENTNWEPIGTTVTTGFKGTLDGQGHTIKNLKAENNLSYGNGFFGTLLGGAVIKNITFENAAVQRRSTKPYSGNVYGIVAGYAYGTVTFENVHVINSEITGFGKVGGILGMAADPNGVTTFKNCSVVDTKINGHYNCGGLMGLAINPTVMTDCFTNATWTPDANNTTYTFEELNTTLADDESVVVKGTYMVAGNWRYAAWGLYYTDQYYSEKYTEAGYQLADGLCHNTID